MFTGQLNFTSGLLYGINYPSVVAIGIAGLVLLLVTLMTVFYSCHIPYFCGLCFYSFDTNISENVFLSSSCVTNQQEQQILQNTRKINFKLFLVLIDLYKQIKLIPVNHQNLRTYNCNKYEILQHQNCCSVAERN